MPKHAPQGPRQASGAPIGVPDPMTVSHMNGNPLRCSATSKGTGQRCQLPAIKGATVCRSHGGNAPQVRAAAAFRVMDAYRALQPKAVAVVETLLDRTEFPTVQMAAVRDVMDRTEGRAGETITVNASVTVVVDRLLAARKRLASNRENP